MNPLEPVLSLKTIAWDDKQGKLISPSVQSFQWTSGLIVRECPFCSEKDLGSNCTCGIYTSPNMECLEEYAKYPNSVYALLHLWGGLDIWSGPIDIPGTYVCRSWGVEVVGFTVPKNNNGLITLAHCADVFDVVVLSLKDVKEMIQMTWINNPLIGIDPYKPSTRQCGWPAKKVNR